MRKCVNEQVCGAQVVIFEGILALYMPEILELLDMKVCGNQKRSAVDGFRIVSSLGSFRTHTPCLLCQMSTMPFFTSHIKTVALPLFVERMELRSKTRHSPADRFVFTFFVVHVFCHDGLRQCKLSHCTYAAGSVLDALVILQRAFHFAFRRSQRCSLSACVSLSGT